MPVVALLAEGLVAFCALAFEVIAARLIAPHAGMSTDTWTAIIGAFLLALALGNRIGGALAASDSPAILLRRASLAAACGGLAVTVAPFAMPAWDGLVLASAPTALWRIVLFAAIPCIPAGLCFGIATPLLMMSVLRATDARGAFAGAMYAAGAAGSVAGVLAALWLLLDQFGVRASLVAIGALAGADALLLLMLSRQRRPLPAIA